MDRLTSMSVFVKAVETGSFAAAANASGMSAPMVGKHVQFLEHRLGACLIHRTTRRHSLTDFGRAYYERCKLVLAEVEAADALALDQLATARGRLRVTLPVLFGRHCVAPILLRLAEQHQQLELELSFNDRPVDLVEGGFDLAIRNGPTVAATGLITRCIAHQRMVVCAAPAYLEAHGRPQSLEELETHHGIIYSRSGRARPWLFPRNGKVAEATPRNRLRLDDLETIADTAVAGMGLAWLPRWLIHDRIKAGALVQLLQHQAGLIIDSHALWLPTPYLPLRLRIAVDALTAGLSALDE